MKSLRKKRASRRRATTRRRQRGGDDIDKKISDFYQIPANRKWMISKIKERDGLLRETPGDDFDKFTKNMKRPLLNYNNYYSQLIDDSKPFDLVSLKVYRDIVLKFLNNIVKNNIFGKDERINEIKDILDNIIISGQYDMIFNTNMNINNGRLNQSSGLYNKNVKNMKIVNNYYKQLNDQEKKGTLVKGVQNLSSLIKENYTNQQLQKSLNKNVIKSSRNNTQKQNSFFEALRNYFVKIGHKYAVLAIVQLRNCITQRIVNSKNGIISDELKQQIRNNSADLDSLYYDILPQAAADEVRHEIHIYTSDGKQFMLDNSNKYKPACRNVNSQNVIKILRTEGNIYDLIVV
jgi:hypothetical protein